MLKFGNKEFRNLQEQVFKNMKDIAALKSSGIVLDEFGIKVVGQESSVANMPTVADYKELNPDWEYGDAYAIGTEAPYTLYILTREDANHESDYWFDIGEFPAPGPQGEQGEQGPQGPQGQTGNPGANGASAGFATPTATVTTLEPGSEATVSITASGPDTSKTFAFSFGIPEGQPGSDASAEWGNISGDIDDQTDLVNALQAKQNVLVSGTSIKTINNESILGSGNIEVAASTVDWDDIQDKPTFATVATSGSYDDLLDKPTIPAAQVNSDWNAESGVAQILNKPIIPDVSNMVTIDTAQTISGNKTFANPVEFSTSDVTFGHGTVTTLPGTIRTDKTNNYGVNLPSTSSFAANKTLATTDQIPVVSYPVTDVEVDGVSVLSGTVAEITMPDLSGYAEKADLGDCAYLDESGLSIAYSQITGTPTIPTKTSDLDNDSGFITSSALSGYATETWVGNQGYITGIDSSDVITALGYTPGTSNFSGSYTDLTDKPSIPTKTSDLNNDSGFITKSVNDLTNYTLSSALATVATSGSYNDLSNKPTIPAAQVNADWTAESGVAQILNKPTLATVATSGSYNDLTDKPTIPTVPVQDVTVNGTSVLDGTTAKVVLQNVTFNTSEYSGGTTIKGIKVNNDYYNVGVSPTDWGDIGGTLSDQTDLQNALNAKADTTSLNNYVDLTTAQTITGQKYFEGASNVAPIKIRKGRYIVSETTVDDPTTQVNLLGMTTGNDIFIGDWSNPQTNVIFAPSYLRKFGENYGVELPSSLTANKVLATTDQIPSLTGYATETWVTSQGYADASDIPTDVSELNNDAGYITSSVDNLTNYYDKEDVDDIVDNVAEDIPVVYGTNDGTNWTTITINSDTYAIPSGGISTVDWSDITNKPTFATVATTGDYDDLLNKPTIPTVNVDDVQINGTSILSSKVANIATNTAYNASTNPIATMSDLPSVPVTDVTVDGVSVVSSGTAAITLPTIPTSLPIETLTTEPTAAYSGPGLKLVYLSAEPTTKYAGYIYMIAES